MRKMDEGRAKTIINALLNDNGRTPEEAAAARAKAAQLMAEMGLTDEDLKGDQAYRLVVRDFSLSREGWNIVSLTGTQIARMCGCRCIVSDLRSKTGGRSDRKLFKFIGYEPDVDLAIWLQHNVLEYGLNAKRQAGLTRSQDRTRFLNAYGARVGDRCETIADNMATARDQHYARTGTALVSVKDQAVEGFFCSQFPNAVTRVSRHSMGGSAGALGEAAGNRVSLGKPVSGAGAVLAIGKK